MPISRRRPLRRLSQSEFGDIAFTVMGHVFAIHNTMGRFLDERIYKHELSRRMPGIRLGEPIDISFDTFRKTLYLDVVANDGGLFEFKAAPELVPMHRAQMLNHLFLSDLAHGKVINIRSDEVEHEFVNATLRPEDRKRFTVDSTRWNHQVPGAPRMLDLLPVIMGDWGTGLAIFLYEEALMHFFQPPNYEGEEVAVLIDNHQVGTQRMRLLAPGVALKLTALPANLDRFEDHARRLLAHLDLSAMAWANFNLQHLTFVTLER